ncbi:stage 0 sporulation family protein [Bacteroidota bacterium]
MSESGGYARGFQPLDIDSTRGTERIKHSCNKLNVFNWLEEIPTNVHTTDIVEVRFKNTRKGFFRNLNKLNIQCGEIIAVEASPGHDIGIVSLTGDLVLNKMKCCNFTGDLNELKKIYRKAKPADIDKWKEAVALEKPTMLGAREIADKLKLEMKIGDVEYQGDKTKAIFYYIADERVDFRELIKLLAEKFHIRIEMRQIGARQEAGRIGGIGACGRELCCTTWLTNFVSVTTNVARDQELTLNPQKLAGQCGKLKCCLNYELLNYLDAKKDFPPANIALETVDGIAYHQKSEIFKKILWYSFDPNSNAKLIPVSIERVKEIIDLNKKGIKADYLIKELKPNKIKSLDYENVVGQESLTRFDEKSKKKKKKKRNK